MTAQQWLRTPMAAMALGCSQNHLKRCRDTHGGFLVGGEHYILGTSHAPQSSGMWKQSAPRSTTGACSGSAVKRPSNKPWGHKNDLHKLRRPGA
jgi:hypothetical protein